MKARAAPGFTLIEVLAALAIVAVVMVALMRTAGMGATALARERELTLASYVAANVLAEARVAQAAPAVGRRTGRMRMGPREWRWDLRVQASPEPSILRLDVRVYAGDGDTDVATSLVGFARARR